MSRLQEDAKKELPRTGEPHADVLKTGRAQIASTGKKGHQKDRQLGMDVRIQRPKDGDVAQDELRHDTTSSLRTDEQEGKVRSGRPSNRVSASASAHCCGFLENEVSQLSKEEGVTLAESMETLRVDLRTRVRRLGAKEKARRKKCKLRLSIIKKNEAFQKS